MDAFLYLSFLNFQTQFEMLRKCLPIRSINSIGIGITVQYIVQYSIQCRMHNVFISAYQ